MIVASPDDDFSPTPSMSLPEAFLFPPCYSEPEPSATSETRSPSNLSQKPQQQLNEVVIAVMGATGSGKTTFINTVSGSQMEISSGLRSCTNIVQVAPPFMLDGRSVTLIDTPGFDDTTRSDTEVLRMIAHFLIATYEHGKKLAGVIYVHRISDFRMGGLSTRNVRMFRELCGDSTLKNVIILTNMWGQVSKDLGEARERELASDELFFKHVLENGAQMLRHDNNLESAQAIIKRFLNNSPLALQIQREIVDGKKDIMETSAGIELNNALLTEMGRLRKEIMALRDEWQAAISAKAEQTRREIELEAKKVREEMSRIEEESKNMATKFQMEKAELEQRLRDMETKAEEERQGMEKRHRNQIKELEDWRLIGASRKRSEDWAKQIVQLQRHRSGGGFFASLSSAIDSVFGMQSSF